MKLSTIALAALAVVATLTGGANARLGAFDEEDENTGTKFPFPLFQFELTSRCPKEFCTFTISRSCISKLFGTCRSCVSCSDKCAWNKMTGQYDCTKLESTTNIAAPEMDEDEADEAAGGIVRPDRRKFIFDQLSGSPSRDEEIVGDDCVTKCEAKGYYAKYCGYLCTDDDDKPTITYARLVRPFSWFHRQGTDDSTPEADRYIINCPIYRCPFGTRSVPFGRGRMEEIEVDDGKFAKRCLVRPMCKERIWLPVNRL